MKTDSVNAAEIIKSVAGVLEEIPDDYSDRYWPQAARAAIMKTLDAIRDEGDDVFAGTIDELKREFAGC